VAETIPISVSLLSGESPETTGNVRAAETRSGRSLHEWGVKALGCWLEGGRAAEAPGSSWREVWLWAARHRCRGILLRALTGASWQTEEDRAQLRDVAFDLGTQALTHTLECKRLESNLRNRGVRLLFLKGVALGLQLYGDAAARAGGDIDCLVEERSVPDALEALAALGYEPEGYSIDQIRSAWSALSVFEHEIALFSRAKQMRIELHWRFFRERRSIESVLRDRGFNRSDSDSSLPCLKGGFSFVYLVMHGAQHGFYAAQWLVDFVVQWRALGEAQRGEARFLVTKHSLERQLGLAGRLVKDVFGVDPEEEGWPKSRRTRVFAIEFASAGLGAADPLAGIDTLWHLRNLRLQLQQAGTWRERWSLLFFSLVTTPSLFRHHLPAFLIFLHPIFRLLDFSVSRILFTHPAGIKDKLKKTPALAIYDPAFIRELLFLAVLVEGSLPIFGVKQTHKWMDWLARLLPPFRFVTLDYSTEQTALLHEQRASCSLLWKPTCVRRALTRCWALRRAGDRGNLQIAFGTDFRSGQRAFHAWVERDRKPLGEFAPHVSSFTRLRNRTLDEAGQFH
jgi:Uncharacterised nucleotidyltransferase/Transglutaminase-like superfamily